MSEDRTRMTTGAGRPVGDNQNSLTVDPGKRLFVATRADIERYREDWQDEIDSASEYRSMAKSATDTRLADTSKRETRFMQPVTWEELHRCRGLNGMGGNGHDR